MTDNKLIMKESCKVRFEPAIEAVNRLMETSEKTTLLVAVEGRCASGKTTLAYYIKSLYDCNLFHMDDFFLQPHQRSEERLREIGGNVDYERFQEEVLVPVSEGKTVNYRPFSCMEKRINDEISIPKKRLNIIEGSYSMHPYFNSPYDLNIFTDISKEQQIWNIRNRNGEERLVRFIEEWIPKEEAYFSTFEIQKGCMRIEWENKNLVTG